MSAQLDLNFAGYDQPNKHGVYVDCERLEMPRSKVRAKAEVRIAYTAKGFSWGVSAEMETEGMGGLPSLNGIAHGQVVPSRDEAIQKACEQILRFCSKTKSKASAAILLWLNGIRGAA